MTIAKSVVALAAALAGCVSMGQEAPAVPSSGVAASTWIGDPGCNSDYRGCGGEIAPQVLVGRYRTITAYCTSFSVTPEHSTRNWCLAYYLPLKHLLKGDTVALNAQVQVMQKPPGGMADGFPAFIGSRVHYYKPDNSLTPFGIVVSQNHGEDVNPRFNIPYKVKHHDTNFTVPADCDDCALLVWVYAQSYGNEGRELLVSTYQGQVSALVYRDMARVRK